MSCIAKLSDFVHFPRPYLHLYPFPFRSHCREVESPVAIGLGDAGPVAQSVGMDAMAVGEKRIDLPAADFLLRIVVVLENDPDGINVVDFLKRHVFCLHLVENGVCALHPCLDFIFESRFVELFANGLDKFLHDFFAVTCRLVEL